MVVFLGTGISETFAGGRDADRLEGRGGQDNLSGRGGDDLLLGGGGNDMLKGGDGLDTINGNKGNDFIFGGSGNDYLLGAQGGDLIFGGDDRDVLLGQGGRDTLYGDDGDDYIAGGLGIDFLFGGKGEDTLDIDGRADLQGGEHYDGGGGNRDRLFLFNESAVDWDLNLIKMRGIERILVDSISGTAILRMNSHMFIDNLTGPNAQIDFGGEAIFDTSTLAIEMDVETSLDLSVVEILMNTHNGLVSVTGSRGDDEIIGNIDGLAEEISGGRGADQIWVNSVNSTVRGEQGNDIIFSDGLGTTIYANEGRDDITLGAFDIGYGGKGGDIFEQGATGSAAYGGAGADTFLLVGDVPSFVDGGNGLNDTLDMRNFFRDVAGVSFTGATIRLSTDELSFRIDGDQVDSGVTRIENVVGTRQSDTIIGDTLNNSLNGLAGDDVIVGDDGDDLIFGGSGNDTLSGGNGFDDVRGGAGNDFVDVGSDENGDAGNLFGGGGNGDTLELIFVDDTPFDMSNFDIRGFELIKAGDPGFGQTGTMAFTASQFDGGIGPGTVFDMFLFDDVTTILDVSMGSSTFLDMSLLSFINVYPQDHLLLTGDKSAEEIIGGDELRNEIIANGGADELFGGSMADDIFGGGGNDTIDGLDGNDDIFGGAGSDVIFGGAGSDQFIYTSINHSKKGQGDTIADFEVTGPEADFIDLSALTVPGTGLFNFIGDTAFSGALGELRIKEHANGLDIWLRGDIDGDRKADFEILLLDIDSFTEANLLTLI